MPYPKGWWYRLFGFTDYRKVSLDVIIIFLNPMAQHNTTFESGTYRWRRFGRRMMKLGFWFFLVKGLLWLMIPVLIAMGFTNF